MANGGILNSLGTCSGVSPGLQDYSFNADFFLLQISGLDIVLGAQWLQTLGEIHWDFGRLVMTFTVGQHTYNLFR